MSVGSDRDGIIKSGKEGVTFSGGLGPSIAKIENADKDEFDDWSKLRGTDFGPRK